MLEIFLWVFLLLFFFFGYLLDFSFLSLSSDPPLADPMETEATSEEGARGNTEDAAAGEEEAGADEPADEEAAKAAGAGAGEGSGAHCLRHCKAGSLLSELQDSLRM